MHCAGTPAAMAVEITRNVCLFAPYTRLLYIEAIPHVDLLMTIGGFNGQ
jgi:hypothetical protein